MDSPQREKRVILRPSAVVVPFMQTKTSVIALNKKFTLKSEARILFVCHTV